MKYKAFAIFLFVFGAIAIVDGVHTTYVETKEKVNDMIKNRTQFVNLSSRITERRT